MKTRLIPEKTMADNVLPAVCFCNTNKAWGGGEKWHFEAACALAARGWQVHLACLEGSPLHDRAAERPDISLFPLSVHRLSFLNPFLQANVGAYFKKNRITSTVLNLPSDVKLFGTAAKQAGVPRILYRRGSDLPVKDSLFNRYLYRHVITGLIVNSEATGKAVLKNNAELIPPERITVLHNGVDAASFDAALEKSVPLEGVRRDGSIVIGNAGRLNHQKGQHFLLHLGQRLKEKSVPFQLVIAGAGEREAELKALAQSLAIKDRVLFTGFLTDLSPFWKSIDIFFLSSLWEGFGFVLAEAMLAQKPLVAFDVSNIPELVVPEQNGLLLPLPENTRMKEAAKAIQRLVDHPDLRQKMGRQGRSMALTKFSQEACMDKLEALLLERKPDEKRPV